MTEQSREKDIQILKLPKNIRQMGKPGGTYRFYIEDYAYTYLNMFLKEHHQEDTLQAAVLLGKWEKETENSYIFASGAAVCDFSVFYEDGEDQIDRIIQNNFPESEIVGWYVRCSGRDSHVQSVVKHYYAEKSAGHHPVFVYEDDYEGDMHICVWEQGALQKLSGYYIYYEKNPRMQEYMIRQKEEYRLADSTVQEEPAAARMRSSSDMKGQVSEPESQKYEKERRAVSGNTGKNMGKSSGKARKTVYAACAAVLITAAATGISQMDNYQSLRQTVQTLSGSLAGKETEQVQNGQKNDSYMEENDTDKSADETENQDRQPQQEISPSVEKNDESTSDQKNDESTSDQQTDGVEQMDMGNENGQETETSKTTNENQEQKDTSERYYTVQRGDSLFSISRSLYHTDDMVDELRRLNGLNREDVIYEGQKLLLP